MTKVALKAQNAAWIWAVVVADAAILAAFVAPSLPDTTAWWAANGSRVAGVSVAPVVALLLTSLLPADLKAGLVYWRLREALPGHRAFSVYAKKDARIDLDRLREVAGEWPRKARDQNTLWYRLFKQIDTAPEVAQAHRHFLLFRDLAGVSVLLAVAAPFVGGWLGSGIATALPLTLVFTIQYFAMAIAARFHGTRLVCNVLALHAASSRPPAKGKKK